MTAKSSTTPTAQSPATTHSGKTSHSLTMMYGPPGRRNSRRIIRRIISRSGSKQAGERQETGAGEGNRTLVVSLGSFCSTIELHPRSLHFTRDGKDLANLWIAFEFIRNSRDISQKT